MMQRCDAVHGKRVFRPQFVCRLAAWLGWEVSGCGVVHVRRGDACVHICMNERGVDKQHTARFFQCVDLSSRSVCCFIVV